MCDYNSSLSKIETHRFSVQKSSFSSWEYIAYRMEILAFLYDFMLKK